MTQASDLAFYTATSTKCWPGPVLALITCGNGLRDLVRH